MVIEEKLHHELNFNFLNRSFASDFYCRIVLGLHVLLRYDIIPNLHDDNFPIQGNKSISEIVTGRGIKQDIYQQRLQEISLLKMLELFFRYIIEDLDIYKNAISVRNQGDVIPKSTWRSNPPVSWRLCIEVTDCLLNFGSISMKYWSHNSCNFTNPRIHLKDLSMISQSPMTLE